MKMDTARRFGIAWVALSLSLAVHVADEALTDFLSVYNPTVLTIRSRIPFSPLPTFTFGVWLGGLIFVVVALLSLSTFAFRGARWMVRLAFFFGFIMFMNGMGHTLSSLFLRRWMPGVYSSPLLLAASVYLLLSARWQRSSHGPA
jgi:Protein of unknown function with HXXEE motif